MYTKQNFEVYMCMFHSQTSQQVQFACALKGILWC